MKKNEMKLKIRAFYPSEPKYNIVHSSKLYK